MNEELLLGRDFEGKEVYIECFHSLIAGQTNLSGKTTTASALAGEAVKQGYTVLFFDTKPTMREFEGYHDIPVCYQPTTDPLVLIGLIEQKMHSKLTKYYSTLGRISQRAKDIKDVIMNAEQLEQRARSGFIKDACYLLADILRRIDVEFSQFKFSNRVELKSSVVNVMPLNKLSNEAQQLVLKTAFEYVLRHFNKKLIVIVDEAFRFFPQDYGSACKKAGMDVITQGAKTKLFVWISTQFIATTEKDVMKACANKLLGRQDDPTEIEATRKRIPGGKSIPADELMTLKRGEFFYVPVEGKSMKVKVIPPWERSYEALMKQADKELGEQVARIELDVPWDRFNEKIQEVSQRLEKLGF